MVRRAKVIASFTVQGACKRGGIILTIEPVNPYTKGHDVPRRQLGCCSANGCVGEKYNNIFRYGMRSIGFPMCSAGSQNSCTLSAQTPHETKANIPQA